MNTLELILLVVAVAAVAGFFWAFMGWQKAKGALDAADARLELMEESRDSMAEFLKAQASQSAEAVATKLVARATETFQAQDRVARERMEAQLKPVSETLARFQEHVAALEKTRAEDTGGLKEQLAALMTASTATRDEARRLTEALKGNTGRRGRWGEQTCRNVLEAAGMAGRFDFEEQNSSANDEGRQQRPDFIVKLPGGGEEGVALDHEPDLMTQAMASRVVIVTPTTLFALCKAVAYGWRAEEQARNAEDVAKLGKELYKRLSVMGGHAASVGRALETAVGKYNQFVGSLESQVMVSARRFEDLQVDHEGKELPDLPAVEQSPRTLSRPELLNAPAAD